MVKTHNFEYILSLLQKDQSFFVALSLDIIIGSIHKLIEHDWNFLLVHLYLLIVVLIEGVTFL